METEAVFRPRYAPALRLALTGLPVLFAAGLFLGLGLGPRMPLWLWWPVIAVGLAAAVLPYFHIRGVEFRGLLVVRRHLLPAVYLEHGEVGDIQRGVLHTTRGTVRLGALQNATELEEQLKRWKAAHTLREAAGQRKAGSPPFPGRGYGTYGFAWGMLLGLLTLLALQGAGNLDARWVFGGAFLAVYLLLGWALPHFL